MRYQKLSNNQMEQHSAVANRQCNIENNFFFLMLNKSGSYKNFLFQF